MRWSHAAQPGWPPWLELTDETSRLTVVREAVRDVAQKKISQGGIPSELAEDMILMSVTLALGTGLFGPSSVH